MKNYCTTKLQTQGKVLDYIRSTYLRNGYPPTIREIMKDLEFKSPRNVTYHIEQLEDRGLVMMAGEYKSRRCLPVGYRVVKEKK